MREIARAHGLITAEKRDSQGLCFIGKVRLPEFLQQQLSPKEGDIITIPANADKLKPVGTEFSSREAELTALSKSLELEPADGTVVGRHQGAHYFTVGQRKGLDVGGTPEPLFVIQTDVKENIIYTGEGKAHPGLFRKALFVEEDEVHWVRTDLALKTGEELRVMARIRYRQELQSALLIKAREGLYVEFSEAQSAITSGQFVAWYEGAELLGSGVIA